ncbi:hypothetical protein N8Z75_01535 [Crocinitomicaceae bacterium]|nr:hypothetical protein [Crocinitomicaceae bacterium]
MRNLKLYNLNTTFDFGMYNGDNLSDVVAEFPGYIRWCLINVNWFVIDQAEFDEEFPEMSWSPTFRDAAERKWNQLVGYETTIDLNDDDVDYYERDSYGEYAGTYAQDMEGLSDDFINDVLGGEPDAYWNID